MHSFCLGATWMQHRRAAGCSALVRNEKSRQLSPAARKSSGGCSETLSRRLKPVNHPPEGKGPQATGPALLREFAKLDGQKPGNLSKANWSAISELHRLKRTRTYAHFH